MKCYNFIRSRMQNPEFVKTLPRIPLLQVGFLGYMRHGQKLDRTASPGSDHSDQLRLTRIGLKTLGGIRTDLKIFRTYKKYDLPQTSSCIGLHFMQQQPGKMQDRVICHFVTLVVPCFLGFPYWFPVSRCNSQSLHHAVASVAQRSQFNSCRDQPFSFSTTFFLLHTCIYLIFYQKKPYIWKKRKTTARPMEIDV